MFSGEEIINMLTKAFEAASKNSPELIPLFQNLSGAHFAQTQELQRMNELLGGPVLDILNDIWVETKRQKGYVAGSLREVSAIRKELGIPEPERKKTKTATPEQSAEKPKTIFSMLEAILKDINLAKGYSAATLMAATDILAEMKKPNSKVRNGESKE